MVIQEGKVRGLSEGPCVGTKILTFSLLGGWSIILKNIYIYFFFNI